MNLQRVTLIFLQSIDTTTKAAPTTQKPATTTTEPPARIVSADNPGQSTEESKSDEMKKKKKVFDEAPARSPQRFLHDEEGDDQEPARRPTSPITREHKLDTYKEENGARRCKLF